MRGVVVALGLAVGWTLTGCSSTFSCQEDSQCEQNGQSGVCQPATGFCSFPSDDCDSGQQYGDLAPDGLAGTCVPATNETDSPGASSSSSSTPGSPSGSTGDVASSSGGATSMPIDPSTSGTTGSTDPSGETTSEGESSGSTGGGPACCNAECPGACAGAAECPPELIGADPPQNSEAIGVAVVGDYVVWSTGFGRSLMLADPNAGIDTELAGIPENSFVTRIAADDTHVYFVDWGGPTVQRVSVPDGEVDLVTTVAAGQAGFGGIAVDDTHVYFSMRNSGGVWRAAKDLSNQKNAQMVAEAESPFGVAVDDDNLYYIDTAEGAVFRLELDSLGKEEPSQIVVSAGGLSAIAVDDEFLYYGSTGVLSRANKLGNNESVVMLAAGLGNIWNVDVDETHAYVSLSTADEVGRVPKDGSTQYESLGDTDQPWGLALGCSDLFWAENGTQTLQRRPK